MKHKLSAPGELERENSMVDNPVDDSSKKNKRKRKAPAETVEEQAATDGNTAKDRKKRKKEEQDEKEEDKPKKPGKAKGVTVHVNEETIESKEADVSGDSKKNRRSSKSQPTDDDSGKKKKKKKKSKKSVIEHSQDESNHEELLSEIPKPKKKRKVSEIHDADDTEPQKKSRHKQKRRVSKDDLTEVSGHTIGPEVDAEEKPHKKKKRKHRDEQTDDPIAGTSEHSEPSASHKKKKRSSHKHSKFPDPSEDSTLSDSAQKALQYVHARVTSQPDWKFNKARQNWVLRNIWDDSTLPEIYFSSCIKYLAGVQGNTRELLVKSSTELIEPPPKAEVRTTSDEAPNQSQDPKPETEGVVGESSEEQERKRALKIARARTLLATLEAGEEKSG